MTRTKYLVVTLGALLTLCSCGKDDPAEDVGTPFDLSSPDASTSGGADAGSDMAMPTSETPRPEIEVVLMDQEVAFTDGRSELLAFEVPDDAVTVTVSVTGPSRFTYSLARWVNGDGENLVPLSWLDESPTAPTYCFEAFCPLQFYSSPSAFSAQLPNNEKVKVEPGTHNIEAYAYALTGFAVNPADDTSATVRVTAKRLPELPAIGVLDINFYFTGARGWTAETVPTDSDFQQLLVDIQRLYDQAGLKLGVITYTDIPEEYSVIENAGFGPANDLEELFELSVGQPRAAVNVFLVEQLFVGPAGFEDFGILLGIAGGIPGPPVGGTRRSGVAISAEGDPRAAVPTSAVIAHEVGHYLGLFHTTEVDQQGRPVSEDAIVDTPENDVTLLMHATGAGDTLTPTQGMVMRHNLWVSHGDTQ